MSYVATSIPAVMIAYLLFVSEDWQKQYGGKWYSRALLTMLTLSTAAVAFAGLERLGFV